MAAGFNGNGNGLIDGDYKPGGAEAEVLFHQLSLAGLYNLSYCVAGDNTYNVGQTTYPGCSLMIQTAF